MVALKLQNFGGMLPVLDNRLLPPNQAWLAQNTWLVSGAVEGIREPRSVYTLVGANTTKAFRIPKSSYLKEYMKDSYWLEFDHPYTDVIQSPSVGDIYDRFYWASPDGQPKYNTKARIAAGNPERLLGVPAPVTPPTVGVTGGVAPTETRAYVYTWVTTYGEEGPPSPPTLFTGNASGTWNITVTAPGAGVTTGRTLSRTRIYRTITGASGATTYYYVGDMAVGTTAFNDAVATTTVAANNILESVFYEPPPLDLQGMVAMPNGIIAGFRANEVYFCEPYLPHAWPSPYALAIEGQIVGLGVIGQTLVVLTTGSPYTISGINPAAMAISRMAFTEPCLSRGSILSTPSGVVYASPNGLAVVVPGSVQVVTKNIFAKDDWLNQPQITRISRLRASAVNGAYYAWGSPARGSFEETAFEPTAFNQVDGQDSYVGMYIDVNDPRAAYVKLKSELSTTNCYMDVWTGETLIIREGVVYWLDVTPTRAKETYIWRSKVFETPNGRNFEAMRIYFNADPDDIVEGTFTGDTWDDTLAWDDTDYWYDNLTNIFGTVRVYTGGNNRLVYQRDIRTNGEMMRLPSGFKATYWYIEIEAKCRVWSVELATTAKELGSV